MHWTRSRRRQTLLDANSLRTTIGTHPRLLPSLEGAMRTYDIATSRHSVRVGHFAGVIGSTLGMDDEDLEALCWAGYLHDLGKLAIAQEVLGRPGPLTADERREVQRHTVTGAQILLSISPRLAPIAEAVRSHHEWWDGTGYPDGLAGDDIPQSGRIIAVADVYDSVTHPRAYREHIYTPNEAIALIDSEAGTHFDPAVADVFAELHRQGRISMTEHDRATDRWTLAGPLVQ